MLCFVIVAAASISLNLSWVQDSNGAIPWQSSDGGIEEIYSMLDRGYYFSAEVETVDSLFGPPVGRRDNYRCFIQETARGEMFNKLTSDEPKRKGYGHIYLERNGVWEYWVSQEVLGLMRSDRFARKDELVKDAEKRQRAFYGEHLRSFTQGQRLPDLLRLTPRANFGKKLNGFPVLDLEGNSSDGVFMSYSSSGSVEVAVQLLTDGRYMGSWCRCVKVDGKFMVEDTFVVDGLRKVSDSEISFNTAGYYSGTPAAAFHEKRFGAGVYLIENKAPMGSFQYWVGESSAAIQDRAHEALGNGFYKDGAIEWEQDRRVKIRTDKWGGIKSVGALLMLIGFAALVGGFRGRKAA